MAFQFTYWELGEIKHVEIPGKVDLIVHPKPAATLMIHRNPLHNDWTVSEFKTGALISRNFKTKKSAKEFCTIDVAIKAQKAIDLNHRNGNDIPFIN